MFLGIRQNALRVCSLVASSTGTSLPLTAGAPSRLYDSRRDKTLPRNSEHLCMPLGHVGDEPCSSKELLRQFPAWLSKPSSATPPKPASLSLSCCRLALATTKRAQAHLRQQFSRRRAQCPAQPAEGSVRGATERGEPGARSPARAAALRAPAAALPGRGAGGALPCIVLQTPKNSPAAPDSGTERRRCAETRKCQSTRGGTKAVNVMNKKMRLARLPFG